MALLEIQDLSFTYPTCNAPALRSINLSVERGELLTVVGATGSGKSTLLRLLKPELWTNGSLSGTVRYQGQDIRTAAAANARVAYVAQNPEEQIVTDKVWHELAFTPENLGMPRDDIARRVAEVSAFFHIREWYDRDTATLSGGQKQLLNLAAVMTADPDILILDEPTAQLDPVAAEHLINTVCRLNRETGLTVIICEHRADLLIPLSDTLVILDQGGIVYHGAPQKAPAHLPDDSPYLSYLPAVTRFYIQSGGHGNAAMTVREGQQYLHARFDNRIKALPQQEHTPANEVALQMKNIYFRYRKDEPDVLRDLSLSVYAGEVFALLGANGAGKSTAASVVAGLRRAYSGSIRLFGKRLRDYRDGTLYHGNIGLLPQDVESMFLHNTVREELKGCEQAEAMLPYRLSPLYDKHPYDLSGGERQLVALCKALATEPRLLIMDEPSKGLDRNRKEQLAQVILALKSRGVTVLLISHDIELAALCADRCAMFLYGGIAACSTTDRFMTDNRFYTTAIARMTKGYYDGAYTVQRALQLTQLNGGAL